MNFKKGKKKESLCFSNNNMYSTKLLLWEQNHIKSKKIHIGIKQAVHSLAVDGYIDNGFI